MSDGSQSFFSFELLDSVSNNTTARFMYEVPVDYWDYQFNYDTIIGTSPEFIYFARNDSVHSFKIPSSDSYDNSFEYLSQYTNGNIVLTDSEGVSNIYTLFNQFGYLDSNDELIDIDYEEWFGYLLETNNLSQIVYQNFLKNYRILDDIKYEKSK